MASTLPNYVIFFFFFPFANISFIGSFSRRKRPQQNISSRFKRGFQQNHEAIFKRYIFFILLYLDPIFISDLEFHHLNCGDLYALNIDDYLKYMETLPFAEQQKIIRK